MKRKLESQNIVMAFKCTGCGCCCKRIDKAVENMSKMPKFKEFKFPYKWDESGKCEKLTNDNKCSVYEDRPLICNVDKMIKFFNLSREEYHKITSEICNKMMDEDEVPIEFRLK